MEHPARTAPRAVLLDRDGTLVHDVPLKGEPALVRPIDRAREAVPRLRSTGIAVGAVTNRSGVARGLLAPERRARDRRAGEVHAGRAAYGSRAVAQRRDRCPRPSPDG